MTLLPVAEELDALPKRDTRGLSQMPWERPAPVPTGPCYWCQDPNARQLLSEPLGSMADNASLQKLALGERVGYEGSAVYACAVNDWAGCRDRKRARDAAEAAAAKAAGGTSKPAGPRRTSRAKQAALKGAIAKQEAAGDG